MAWVGRDSTYESTHDVCRTRQLSRNVRRVRATHSAYTKHVRARKTNATNMLHACGSNGTKDTTRRRVFDESKKTTENDAVARRTLRMRSPQRHVRSSERETTAARGGTRNATSSHRRGAITDFVRRRLQRDRKHRMSLQRRSEASRGVEKPLARV